MNSVHFPWHCGMVNDRATSFRFQKVYDFTKSWNSSSYMDYHNILCFSVDKFTLFEIMKSKTPSHLPSTIVSQTMFSIRVSRRQNAIKFHSFAYSVSSILLLNELIIIMSWVFTFNIFFMKFISFDEKSFTK